jgi:hypothetical protein
MYSNFKLLQLSNSGFHEHFSIIEFVSLACHLVIIALECKTAASTCAALRSSRVLRFAYNSASPTVANSLFILAKYHALLHYGKIPSKRSRSYECLNVVTNKYYNFINKRVHIH